MVAVSFSVLVAAFATVAASPVAPAAVAADDVVIAPVDPVLSAGEPLVIEIDAGAATSTDRTVDLGVARRAIATRSGLRGWLDGESTVLLEQIGSTTLPAGEQSVSITVAADALPFASSLAGAFAVAAQIEGTDESARTVVVGDDAGASTPTRLALAMPVTSPETPTGLVSSPFLAAATEPGGELARELLLAETSGIALGLDPMVAASIAALGDAAPPTATDWLTRAAALPQTYVLPYGGADAVALSRAGVTEPAVAGIPAADDTLLPASAAQLTPTISPVIDATAASVDDELVRSLAAGGTPMITTSAIDESLGRVTPSAHVSVDGVSALAADEHLQAVISEACAAEATESLNATARVLSVLATVQREAPSLQRTLAATLCSGPGTENLLNALRSVGWIELTSIAEALGGTPRDAELLASEPTDAEQRIAGAVAELTALEASVTGFGTAVDEPERILTPLRLELLAAIAATTNGADAVEEFRERTDAIRDGVQVAEGGRTLIVSGEADLQVTITNSLEVPVHVLVTAQAGNPTITVDAEPVAVTIDPASQQRVPIPVQAVGPGQSSVQVMVTAPDGTVVTGPAVIQIDSEPALEGIVIGGLGAAVVLLLGFGIARSIAKRRRGAAVGDIDTAIEAAEEHK